MSASSAAKPLIIVYHASCIDGAASAWTVAKALGVETPAAQRNVTYVPYEHFNEELAQDKIRVSLSPEAELYFVDAIPGKAFLDELMTAGTDQKAKLSAIHILDHHKTADAILKNYAAPVTGLPTPALEINIHATSPSATKMIWEKLLPAEKMPALIDLIDLMDGGAEGLKTSKDFAAAAFADSKDIRTINEAFDSLRALTKLSFNTMAKKGARLYQNQKNMIDKLFTSAMIVQLQVLPDMDAVPVPLVNGNVQDFGRSISSRLIELGEKAGSHVALVWSVQKNGAVSMSIRTNGSLDAGKVAQHLCKTMGGISSGGHKDAAAVHFSSLRAFSQHMPLQNFPPSPPPKPVVKGP